MNIIKLFVVVVTVSSFQIFAKEPIDNSLTTHGTSSTRPFIQGVLTHTLVQPKHFSSYVSHLVQILFQNPSRTTSWPPQLKPDRDYQLELVLGYEHPLSVQSGFATPEPQKYGIKDVIFNVYYPLYNGILGIVGVTYPLSMISRSTSLQISSTLGLSYQNVYQWYKHNISLKVSSLITGFLYKYRSTGMFANPLIAGYPSIQLQTQLKGITASTHMIFAGIYDYDKVLHFSQQLKVQTSYTLKNINFFLAYLWSHHSRNSYINLNQFLVFGTGFQAGLTWKV